MLSTDPCNLAIILVLIGIAWDYQPLEAVTAGSVLALFHYIPQQLKQNR
ncbi:hypothetical protein Tsp_08179 [Trichinella spiralis]|nr:hypothetical protein Tsp_08179 [Trichinella spiralis]